MMENQAIKIECGDWTGLRALYLPETPETILGLTTISNYIHWNEKESPIQNLDIYSLNGDWSDGTFVLVVCVYSCYFEFAFHRKLV